MAEGFLKELLKDKKVSIRSAGTAGISGLKASEEARRAVKADGIDISAHRSVPITGDIIDSSDIILVMEYMHQESILHMSPGSGGKIHLITEYSIDDEDKGMEIPDPIGKPLEVYERVYDMIKRSLDGFATEFF